MARPTITREQLLALTPKRYLAKGWFDVNGQPWAQMNAGYALAASLQLERARASPQEVGAVYQAYQQLLPLYEVNTAERLTEISQDALDLVVSTLGQPNNPGLLAWLEPCVLAVHDMHDLQAFFGHFKVVLQQYAALIASRSTALGA